MALGSALGNMTFQTSQVAGFLAGGILVATLGAYRSLALDALSFCLSAALITCWPPRRVSPRAQQSTGSGRRGLPGQARE